MHSSKIKQELRARLRSVLNMACKTTTQLEEAAKHLTPLSVTLQDTLKATVSKFKEPALDFVNPEELHAGL